MKEFTYFRSFQRSPAGFSAALTVVCQARQSTIRYSRRIEDKIEASGVLPCKMSSGSVRVSFSPPSGTCHTRIFASSPARETRYARQITHPAANAHTYAAHVFTYQRQAGSCQKGPSRSRSHLQNSGWWAGMSLVACQAESAEER